MRAGSHGGGPAAAKLPSVRALLAALLLLGSAALAQPVVSFALGVMNALVPREGWRRVADLPYGEGPRRRLDVYVPEPKPATPPPVVVFGYGGGYRHGEKGDYLFVGQALAELGLVAVVYDYRLYPEVSFPETLADPALAVRWAAEHAAEHGGDPTRLVLAGHSAGAHAAAMLASDPARLRAAGVEPGVVRAVIGLSGGYDFGPPFGSREIEEVMGDPAGWTGTQPIRFVDGDEPPFAIFHGAKDTLLGVEGARRMVERLRSVGVRALYYEYPEGDHNNLLTTLGYPLRSLGTTHADLRDALERLGLLPR